jgi:hypothetical protein
VKGSDGAAKPTHMNALMNECGFHVFNYYCLIEFNEYRLDSIKDMGDWTKWIDNFDETRQD